MKALTVRAPWAPAIMHLGKNVENRSRNVAGSYRGPLAIHTSATVDRHLIPDVERIAGKPMPPDPSPRGNWYAGYVVGLVDLVGVHRAGSVECGPRCVPWGAEGGSHLMLEDPRPLPRGPVWAPGKLGLWEISGLKLGFRSTTLH